MTGAIESLVTQVKSRLLPLSPVASAIEWLIERLPRRLIHIELIPIDDVQIIDEVRGEYKSTGHEANFEMIVEPAIPRQGGWYYLEAALVRNNGCRDACIRVFVRGKNKEIIVIPIPTNLRGSVREVFYLPPNVFALIWSPTGAAGYFSQSRLLLHKITALESTLRRISRVIFDLWRFRNNASVIHAALAWLRALGNLQVAYQLTVQLRLNRLMGNDYASFIALNDSLSKADVLAMQQQASRLTRRPLISVIMPVRAPMAGVFRESLDAIAQQIYPHWELLLVGDFSADQASHEIACQYQETNPRLRIIAVQADADMAAIFNSALGQAQGEYVVRVGQHDKLPLHAIFCLAQEINKHPDAELIYTDEDSIDETSERSDPRFKPDWNPDLFFSNNYLANLTLYRKKHVLELGGYRIGFEGAEGYDLSLRYLKDTEPSKIRHIPRVLYHARATNQPTNQLLDAIDSPLHEERPAEEVAHQSAKRALDDYFNHSGVVVEDGPSHGLYHLKHPLPSQPPLVSIIIPTRDRVDILRACIASIQTKTDYENWEMLVVDNQSVEPATHAYLEQIKSDARMRVINYEKPFNYSAMNNYAVQCANGEILALLNNDVEVINKEWLSEMVSHAIRPEVGAVGAKLLYANGMVQHAGVITGLGGVAGHAHKYLKADDHGYCHRAVLTQNLSAVTGACLVVRKSCYQEVGGLNEVDLVVALNDIDFCLKLLKKGYRNVFTPFARLYHHESISRGRDDTPEKHALFIHEFEYMKKTWGGMLQHDPAYNPNLTLEFENFSLSNKRNGLSNSV